MITPSRESIVAFEDAGLVTVRSHNTLPLRIVNYTPKAQFDRAWTPELLHCRGIVFDHEWNLVSRCLPKFFNYEEHLGPDAPAGPLPSGPFTVTEKHDGSLGLLFKWRGNVVLSTRGSFHSEQADRGYEILKNVFGGAVAPHLDEEHTHALEIIYPENRIVVDYGNREELRWITSIRIADGSEVMHPIATSFGGHFERVGSDPAELKSLDIKNAEGYVLKYSCGARVKVKFDEYVRLHRIVTGLSTTSVWEHLSSGFGIQSLLEPLPDEWMEWARGVAQNLIDEYDAERVRADSEYDAIYESLGGEFSRKDFAMKALKSSDPSMLFLIHDDNWSSYNKAIWKKIKPSRETPILEQC